MIASIISAILMTAIPMLLQEQVQNYGGDIKNRAEKLAKDIYTKLSNNTKTRDKLIEAYQTKNNDLLTSLVNQSGYGPQAEALRRELVKARDQYNAKNSALVDKNTELTNQYNQVVNAGNQAGISFSGNSNASNNLDQVESLVNGGAENA